MTASLRGVDGSAAAPGVAFTAETNSGVYRAGAGDVRLAVTGTDVLKAAAAGVTALVPLTVSSGTLALTQAAGQSILKTGGALAVGTTDANEVLLATNNVNRFTITAAGEMVSAGNRITGLPTPVAASDAVPKSYLDSPVAASGFNAGALSGGSGVYNDLAGLTATMTPRRPVLVSVQGGGGAVSYLSVPAGATANIRLLRDAVALATWTIVNPDATNALNLPLSLTFVEAAPGVGASHTWKLQMDGATSSITGASLVVIEL